MTNSTKSLIASQLVLGLGLVFCISIEPSFLFRADQGGVSNYGVHARTIVPFTVGLGGAAVLVCLAAWQLTVSPTRPPLKRALWWSGLSQLAVLITTYPYKLSHSLDLLHIASAVGLLCIELAIVCWAALSFRVRSVQLLALLFGVSFLLAAATFAGWLHILFLAEVMTAFAYGSLLIELSRIKNSRP